LQQRDFHGFPGGRIGGSRRAIFSAGAERVQLDETPDQLTGIPNRKAFDNELQESVDRAIENGEPLSLVMCDIDGRVQELLDAYHLTEEIGPANIYATRREVIAAFGRRTATDAGPAATTHAAPAAAPDPDPPAA